MSSNSFIVRPVNDLKRSGFWIICHRKAKKGHAIDELVIIKLFGSNYARDLIITIFDNLF